MRDIAMSTVGASVSIGITVISLAALLVAEKRDWRLGIWIAKPLAAAGYLALAVSVGALETTYGQLIFAALLLSFSGDVFLIPEEKPTAFKIGILSFLLGHVAYTVAFATREVDLLAAVLVAILVAVVARVVLRWLIPHVESELRGPVYAYVVVISSMLVFAAGTARGESRPDIIAGAFLFYLSDLAVARDRFVHPGFWNRAWGLPFYFGAQLILAWGAKV
jgi:uncharacterized membrane protein YhhN